MEKTRTIELKGHIIDSLTLTKVMDSIIDAGAKCNIDEIDIGAEKNSISYARLCIVAENNKIMDNAIEIAKKQGAFPVEN